MELAFVHLDGLESIVKMNVKMENMELAVFLTAIVPVIPCAAKLMAFVRASLDTQGRDVIRSARRDFTEWTAYLAVTVTRAGLFLVTMKLGAFVKLVQLGKGIFSCIQYKKVYNNKLRKTILSYNTTGRYREE